MKKNKKKLSKLKVGIAVFIVVLFLTVFVFGEYIYTNIQERYFVSKSFYFSSNLLDLATPNYDYSNWSGIGSTEIPIELYSYTNELLKMDEDIQYELKCSTTSSKVVCGIDSPTGDTTVTGNIYTTTNKVKHRVYISPNLAPGVDQLTPGERVKVKIEAKGIGKYTKSISAEFNYEITDSVEFQVSDNVGDDYAVVTVKNTNTGNSKVTLTFNPEQVRLDLNNNIYINASTSDYTTQTIDEIEYVKSITFSMLPESSQNIKFYKLDVTQNYTYPGEGATSIVECSLSN